LKWYVFLLKPIAQNAAVTGARKKKEGKFQHAWLARFGLEITATDAVTSVPVSLRCRFCEFGKHVADPESWKRKKTGHIKFFTAAYRVDNIKRHVNEYHAQRYAEYLASGVDLRPGFFKAVEVQRPLAVFVVCPDTSNEDIRLTVKEKLRFNITKEIVDVILK